MQRIPGAEFHNLKFKSARAVSTDSRTVSGSQIFFALRGEQFDGHNYVGDAIGKNAVCAIVDRKWFGEKQSERAHRGEPVHLPLVVVDDTTRALGDLARIYRRKFSMPVIAVGGSNGKTTTKEMIAEVLDKKFRVLKTSGNQNNRIGVPLTIFGFKTVHEIAVVEIGTNHFGEIQRLCEILEPTAGIVTNIGNEHLEFFKNLNGVKKEEGRLFNYLAATKGTAFVNADDNNLVDLSKELKRKLIFGFTSRRGYLSGQMFGMDGRGCVLFELKYKNKTEVVSLRVPGFHNAMNALAAAAVGTYYGVKINEVKNALESYRAFEKRMEIVKAGGVTILNDTYNSNPESASAALRWLSAIRPKGKRIAVLADMLELGLSAKREHQKIGREIAKENLDYLFTFGNLGRDIAAAAECKIETEAFDDKDELSEKLLLAVGPGDVVLVKGSRGMKMEEVVKKLANGLRNRGHR